MSPIHKYTIVGAVVIFVAWAVQSTVFATIASATHVVVGLIASALMSLAWSTLVHYYFFEEVDDAEEEEDNNEGW